MKDLPTILAELQALDTTALNAVEAQIILTIADLTAFIAANPAADPVVSIATTSQAGVVAQFVPKA